MTTSRRSLEFAWLTLLGIPGHIWCGSNHICGDGHLYHDDMPGWWLYVDFVWAAAFLAAAVSVLRSDVPFRVIPFGLLLYLVFSRLLWASYDGFTALVFLAVLAGLTLYRAHRQKKQPNSNPSLLAFLDKPNGAEPPGKDEFSCFDCGGVIHPGEDSCRASGWRWK